MQTYRRETRVAAPLEKVWTFHDSTDGLERLTPDWMDLRVEAIRGPDGEPNPRTLTPGTRIHLSMRPLGTGPRRRWVSRIRDRERRGGSAYFVDDMQDGPFREWEHTHSFFADGDGTVIVDTVRYRLPFGWLGDVVAPLAKVGFEAMFRDRHARTKAALEGTEIPVSDPTEHA